MSDTPSAPTTAATVIQDGELLATAAQPFLPPNVQIALSIAMAALQAIQAAAATGTDVTDAQLATLGTAFQQQQTLDLAAQAAAT